VLVRNKLRLGEHSQALAKAELKLIPCARRRPREGRLASAHPAGQSRTARCSSVMRIKMLGLSSIGAVREIRSLTPPYPAPASIAPNPPSPASLRNFRRFMMPQSQESILPPKINGDDPSPGPLSGDQLKRREVSLSITKGLSII